MDTFLLVIIMTIFSGGLLWSYLVGFYVLLVAFRVNPWLSIGGAIAFALGSYNLIIIVAGHNTKAVAIAYMAPIIGSVYLAFREKRLLGTVLLTLFLGLSLFANHISKIALAIRPLPSSKG